MSPVAIKVSRKLEDTAINAGALKIDLPLPSASHSTLPAQWMTDESIFDLEKRAIFSKVPTIFAAPRVTATSPDIFPKVWLLTSHTSHFSGPGDYISGM